MKEVVSIFKNRISIGIDVMVIEVELLMCLNI